MGDTDNAIELRGLRKVYAGGKVALEGLDLDVPKGAIFGLLGPNGAGKSTTINIMAGLVLKTAGSVRIWGFDQEVNPRHSRASIGVVPQELNLDPFFTPHAALEVQAGLYGVRKADRRTAEILEAVGLADKAHAHARSLSGGMRRRLLIAKALVHRPPVLVLDEPTAGVDIELRQLLWRYVRELNEDGTTIILTTHYLEEAQEMCGRIAIMNHGKLVAVDDTPALLSRLDAKTLVVTPEAPVGDAPSMPEGVTATVRPTGELAFGYKARSVGAGQILEAVRAAGIGIRDVATEQADLEDVFLDLTRSA